MTDPAPDTETEQMIAVLAECIPSVMDLDNEREGAAQCEGGLMMWDFALLIAAMIVCFGVGVGYAALIWAFPRKLTPDDFESPDHWGDQPHRRD